MSFEIIKIKYQLKPFFIIFKNDTWLIGLTLVSPVESPSCYNDFSLDLEDKTKHGVATNLFCLGVIGHPEGLSFYKN